MVDFQENCILFDWLTFSIPVFPDELLGRSGSACHALWSDVAAFLGLETQDWNADLTSSLCYEFRAACGGISIHYTTPFYDSSASGKKRNLGFCVEMSGQGVRFFETFGKGSVPDLLRQILAFSTKYGWNCSRLDLAYDDFTGLINLSVMADQAQVYAFTSRSQSRKIFRESSSDPEADAITVCHGSRSSNIFIRCYDKRLERSRLDVPHWVRLEIQFRHENAIGVIKFLQADSVGNVFSGVLSNYLIYRDPNPSDSNKRRWDVSPWWEKLLRGIAPIMITEKKTVEYNFEDVQKWVHGTMSSAVKTLLALEGDSAFLDYAKSTEKEIPEKYKKLLRDYGKDSPDLFKEYGIL